MAKLQITVLDSSGNPQSGQAVQIKRSSDSVMVASTNSSDTGGVATIVDLGNGAYITNGTYSTFLSSGHLITGEYTIYKGGVAQIGYKAHIDPDDVSGALTAANNLSDVASAATCRTNLGLVIGTNVEAYDADNAIAAGVISGWVDVGDTYPFLHYDTGLNSLAPASASTFRTALGLGTAALLDTEEVQETTVSTDAPPTADSTYAGKFWCKNSGTGFAMYVCVRTAESTYAWRLLQCANSGGTDREDIFYTYGGA